MKIKINQTKEALGKLFLNIAKHAFLVSLILFFLALIFGGFLFYKYDILAQKAEQEDLERAFLIKEENYQGVLEVWQKNQEKFQEADLKEYPDPFVRVIPTP